jgi:TonB family protein
MPKELPKLVKYEQRRKIQDGINIDKANEKPKELKDKRDKPKEAELDKRKKDPLDDILDAPEDDDPRKRPTDLDDIVGREDGDFHGMDLGDMKGHPALARMIGALRSEMTVSQMIPSNELRKLKTRVRIDIDYTGAIRKLSIIDSSGNKHFDTAVRQAVQRFMPASGGSRRLPIVPKPIREAINSGQIRVLIDGSRLRR